jgi:hypothetical protein
MAINRSKFLGVLISVFYAVIVLTFMPIRVNWLEKYMLLLSITFIFQIIIMKLSKIKLLSISFLFLIFTYIFHFSHVLLLFFQYDFEPYYLRNLSINKYGVEAFLSLLELAFWFSYAVFLGFLLSNMKNNTLDNKKIKANIETNNFHFILGIILIVLSFPIDFFYMFIGRLIQSIQGGYLAVHEYEINYILRLVSYLLLPGVFLVITSSNISRSIQKLILILLISYKVVSMMTGLRAYNLISIIIFLYYYFKINNMKIKLKHVMILGLSMLVLGNLLVVIREMRHSGIAASLILSEIFNIDNNIIFNLMQEFGGTINMVGYVYNNISEPSGGSQLISSIVSILPRVSTIFNYVNWSSMSIVDKLDTWNMGGSFIADFYFDFGYWGILMSGLYGFIIQKVDDYINFEILRTNYIKAAFFIPILIEIIFTVRSSTAKLPRMIVWYSLLFLAIKSLTKLMIKVGSRRKNMKIIQDKI